jgi:hypothetical protein
VTPEDSETGFYFKLAFEPESHVFCILQKSKNDMLEIATGSFRKAFLKTSILFKYIVVSAQFYCCLCTIEEQKIGLQFLP